MGKFQILVGSGPDKVYNSLGIAVELKKRFTFFMYIVKFFYCYYSTFLSRHTTRIPEMLVNAIELPLVTIRWRSLIYWGFAPLRLGEGEYLLVVI